ncbi:hypothetical protein [Deminuibacter soli]|uniref:Uncharacterized protein n=1 Tax=Deminuibacter soli TaxID=2291815 RepID=A0A3E1NM83_9BACT|nr:hypothetical protein [Deminuibacter soli]RFM29011.1 hypothetical protein DXN05_09615 [Deminuibacter soli]
MQRFFLLIISVLLLTSCSKMKALKKAGTKIRVTVFMCTHKLPAEATEETAPVTEQDATLQAPSVSSPSVPSRYNWDAKMAIW